jgi:hypothetical protein
VKPLTVQRAFSPGSKLEWLIRKLGQSLRRGRRFLILATWRPGRDSSRTDFDASILLGNQTSSPVALAAINTEANEVFVSSSANGDLYFSSDKAGGERSNDLYWAKKTGSGYQRIENLKILNTPASEGNPAIAPNGHLLVFVRDGHF